MMLELNKIYNMDCMEGMKAFPDKYFELAIVDPPYGMGESGAGNASRGSLAKATDYKPYTGGDKEPPDNHYFKELFRVSKNQIIWGANHYISRIPLDSSCWIVWDKENGATDFADCELAWSSFPSAVRIFKYRWQGMLQGNMKNKEIRIHPNQKPMVLYEWIMNNYAKPGDKILSTHGGSCPEMIAAYNLGYDCISFETDPDYYQKAVERLNDVKAQVRFAI